MPRISVWMIRTAMLYLVSGFTLGGVILVQKGIGVVPSAWRLLPAHIEVLFFGWTIQLVMGVAFWILPRFSGPPVRGKESLVWTAYGLLNLGVLLVIFGPNVWMAFIGRLAEGLGLVAFVVNAWPRVKAFGK